MKPPEPRPAPSAARCPPCLFCRYRRAAAGEPDRMAVAAHAAAGADGRRQAPESALRPQIDVL